jgi:hypothetical protein
MTANSPDRPVEKFRRLVLHLSNRRSLGCALERSGGESPARRYAQDDNAFYFQEILELRVERSSGKRDEEPPGR